ncbi:hypothetical protein FA95DRAFT_1495865 [Auriscalpium vulgare]|uniref:Uncharacterized protein n=1 Tax=Auriscalpium vulgare TaxID=40419 RepID=A0ACB8RNI5_9AGAM|nr:hypothetical protein FA95DRAFT_1495865 [Auriscalpium vulgare]
MRKTSSETTRKDQTHNLNRIRRPQTQHGFLLALPSESLTHITSFLDPKSLLTLGRTNKRLYEHIKDDNTWHRAFVCQILGIGPEAELHGLRSLTLRRTESSWREEFSTRYAVRRRWIRSRSSTIAHSPHHAQIARMHLVSEDALLSSSLEYGIVARSFPLSGKIMKGFLDSTGMRHGMGIGNPNAEFAPNISVCVLASDGASARIIWGRRDGSINITFHPRTMSGTRAPAKVYDSRPEEEHTGAITDATWSDDGHGCVTVGADGRMKIWTMRHFACVWTSERNAGTVYTKVVQDLVNGIVAVAAKGGVLLIYSGFDTAALWEGASAQATVKIVSIPPPALTSDNPNTPPETGVRQEIGSIYLDMHSVTRPSILVSYVGIPYFFRLNVDFALSSVQVLAFGDPSSGPITCIMPSFSLNANEPGFVVVGNMLGSVSVYDWDAGLSTSPISPVYRIDIFSDAAVTSVAVNDFAIVAGSSRGSVRAIDVLLFDQLRSFAAPANDSVRQIILRRYMVISSVGSRILAWKAASGSDNKQDSLKVKGKGKVSQGTRKWHKQYELRQDIAESRDDLKGKHRASRDHEQTTQLDSLGLTEQEAVEYALMLSRDEQAKRRAAEESVFAAGFDDEGASSRHMTAPASPTLHALTSSFPSIANSYTRSHLPILPSPSNVKVQVSPRFYPEAMEAGDLPSSPLDLSPPIMSPEPAVAAASSSFTTRRVASGVYGRASSMSRAPAPSKSAWNSPIRVKQPSPPPPTSGQGYRQRAPTSRPPPVTASDTRAREQGSGEMGSVEDDDLRFALELSLAEARSKQDEEEGC